MLSKVVTYIYVCKNMLTVKIKRKPFFGHFIKYTIIIITTLPLQNGWPV